MAKLTNPTPQHKKFIFRLLHVKEWAVNVYLFLFILLKKLMWFNICISLQEEHYHNKCNIASENINRDEC